MNLKFKVWDKISKIMHKENSGFFLFTNGVLGYNSGNTYEIVDKDNFQTLTHTGLKDKDGKDIYEGDILSGYKSEQDGTNGYEIKDIVRFHPGGFSVFSKNLQGVYTKDRENLYQFMWHESGSMINRTGYYYKIEDMRKIGNIYENAELLNVQPISDMQCGVAGK